MERKLAVLKDGVDGQRIAACLEHGLPLNVLEAVGRGVPLLGFASHRAKSGHYIFLTAFVFTARGRSRVAVFERAARKRDGTERATKGRGIFCSVTPDLSGNVPFEAQVLQKIQGVRIDRVRVLGEGISARGAATYLLTVIEVVLAEERPIVLKDSDDWFCEFVETATATERLGEGREVDREVLAFLQGCQVDTRSFVPSAIDCAIRRMVIGGLDIYRFSTLPNTQQVFRYFTLQVLVEKSLREAGLSAHTIQTGDGCFIVFEGAGEAAAFEFCLDLQRRAVHLQRRPQRNPLRLRYALHAGPVYQVTDLNRQVNFIGDGINFCARLLGVKEADVLYVSQDFLRALPRAPHRESLGLRKATLAVKHARRPAPVYVRDLKRRPPVS